MPEPEIYWIGAQGKRYRYWSHRLPYRCDPGQDGNYILTKLRNNIWIPIYIGEGNLDERINDPTHYNCAIGKGATHVHLHLNATEQARLAEESDLLAGHPDAYAPIGCNQKPGG